jgi:hypothetical protein
MMKQERTMYTAEQIWGAAMAAHRINGGYFKEPQWDYDKSPAVVVRDANKLMVKAWIKSGDLAAVTPEDITKGQEVRNHFNSYMMLAIAGKLNDFQQQAYKIAQLTEFSQRDHLEIAIASCLPSIYERDRQRKEFVAQVRESQQLSGAVGDRVAGEIVVLQTRYNVNFSKYKISAKMDDSFVDFWYNTNLNVGAVIKIKGKIKAQRGDNTTQLNYVKQVS